MALGSTAAGLLLMALLGGPPAQAQSDIGSEDIPLDLPDLALLFRARPPMGDCPLGEEGDAMHLGAAEHLLHLGAARFYLDYRRRLGLSEEQRRQLEVLRADAVGAWAREQARIDQSEVALWALTGAPEPDEDAIAEAIRGLEAVRAAQRIAYVGSVLEASRLLKADQRRELVGEPSTSP